MYKAWLGVLMVVCGVLVAVAVSLLIGIIVSVIGLLVWRSGLQAPRRLWLYEQGPESVGQFPPPPPPPPQ